MSYDDTPPRNDPAVRNARCSCGSGRKFKKCCGRPPLLLVDEPPLVLSLPPDPEPETFFLPASGKLYEIFSRPEPPFKIVVHPSDVERFPILRERDDVLIVDRVPSGPLPLLSFPCKPTDENPLQSALNSLPTPKTFLPE